MSKYIGKRILFKILNQCAPCNMKMKDCDYDNLFGDECVSYVSDNFQFCIFSHSYGKEFIYTVYKISNFFDGYTVFEEKIHPVFIEKYLYQQ
jgi:hypothetical protein